MDAPAPRALPCHSTGLGTRLRRNHFAETETFKRLGAFFDLCHRVWRVPVGKDLEPFARWIDYQQHPELNHLFRVGCTQWLLESQQAKAAQDARAAQDELRAANARERAAQQACRAAEEREHVLRARAAEMDKSLADLRRLIGFAQQMQTLRDDLWGEEIAATHAMYYSVLSNPEAALPEVASIAAERDQALAELELARQIERAPACLAAPQPPRYEFLYNLTDESDGSAGGE